MTTTVCVKARAWGAKVEVNGETVELSPNSERNFQIQEGESTTLTVTHGEQPTEEEIPGRAQNDALVQEVSPERLAEVSGQTPPNTTTPVGNMSGATEVASSTDGAVAEGAPPARRR